MTKKLLATIADALVCFQEEPGTNADKIITGGDGKIMKSSTVVKSQGKGYYGFKFDVGSTIELKLLDTTYHIQHKKSTDFEVLNDDKYMLTNWLELSEKTKLAGIQQRLQILGYYLGIVDNKRGKKTERAILNFQADNQLRTDGIAGPKTCKKLDDIIQSDNKSGKHYIIRKSLIRFARAPVEDPKIWIGRPLAKAPDPDDRGYSELNTLGETLGGPVVTMCRNTEFRIKMIRENISNNSQLVVKSLDKNTVEVISPVSLPFPSGPKAILPKEKTATIILKAVNPGNTQIEIYLTNSSGDIKIGSLKVIVLSLITRLVRPYYVTIADAGGNNPTAPPDSQDEWNKIFDITNNIWWPYGIYFKFLPWRIKTVNLATHGQLDDTKAEFDSVVNTADTGGKNSEEDKINLLVVNSIDGAFGITWDAHDFTWPNGIAIAKNPKGNVSTGIDLAHEFGHFLSLANCYDYNCVHAEDDPDDSNKKKDIWSIRRLMYGGWPTVDRAEAWAHNVGYGNGQYGCMVSVRNLPKDKPDNECKNARKWALSPNFYKKP